MRNQKEFFSFVTYPKICHTTDKIFGKLSIVSLFLSLSFRIDQCFSNGQSSCVNPPKLDICQFCRNGNGVRSLLVQICNTLLCRPVVSNIFPLPFFPFLCGHFIGRSFDYFDLLCLGCSAISIFSSECFIHVSTISYHFHKYAINMKIYAVSMWRC